MNFRSLNSRLVVKKAASILALIDELHPFKRHGCSRKIHKPLCATRHLLASGDRTELTDSWRRPPVVYNVEVRSHPLTDGFKVASFELELVELTSTSFPCLCCSQHISTNQGAQLRSSFTNLLSLSPRSSNHPQICGCSVAIKTASEQTSHPSKTAFSPSLIRLACSST